MASTSNLSQSASATNWENSYITPISNPISKNGQPTTVTNPSKANYTVLQITRNGHSEVITEMKPSKNNPTYQSPITNQFPIDTQDFVESQLQLPSLQNRNSVIAHTNVTEFDQEQYRNPVSFQNQFLNEANTESLQIPPATNGYIREDFDVPQVTCNNYAQATGVAIK